MADLDANRATRSADCCQPTADPRIQNWFDRKVRRLATAGDAFPIGPVSRRLLGLLGDVGDTRPSVLELGCGPGALTLALLERGASKATGVDLSPESLVVARRRTSAAGFGDRSDFQLGDGAVVPLEPHDWVVLDKVLCCYRDLDALLDRSIAAARRRYIFVVPDSRSWRGLLARWLVRLENLTNSLRGRPCPGYVHDLGTIEARLTSAGFRPACSPVRFRFWYLAVFESPD
jgi:magnesium-protoporphyrin O-methyltransferase